MLPLSLISSPLRFAGLLFAASLTVAGGCAGRPEAPILELPVAGAPSAISTRLAAMLPADVLLVGEQHDADEHHKIEQQIIAELARKGLLAAVVLEMSDVGLSTARLKPSSSEEQTRRALKWDDKGWPWAAYAPAVMTAVRAEVPVLGGNLPRGQMAASMEDGTLDARLRGPALKAQQQAIRIGHCNLLPESQITPMTRVQIAKDISMARALEGAALLGKVVVLLAGNGHVDRQLGVPKYLSGDLKVRVIHLRAGQPEAASPPDALDSVWTTPALPATDYCADLKRQLAPKP